MKENYITMTQINQDYKSLLQQQPGTKD